MTRLVTFAVTFTVLAAAAISPVAAFKPSSETIVLDDHFVDSDLCKDDVTVDGSGHIRFATFSTRTATS